jgi:hypothetical protein
MQDARRISLAQSSSVLVSAPPTLAAAKASALKMSSDALAGAEELNSISTGHKKAELHAVVQGLGVTLGTGLRGLGTGLRGLPLRQSLVSMPSTFRDEQHPRMVAQMKQKEEEERRKQEKAVVEAKRKEKEEKRKEEEAAAEARRMMNEVWVRRDHQVTDDHHVSHHVADHHVSHHVAESSEEHPTWHKDLRHDVNDVADLTLHMLTALSSPPRHAQPSTASSTASSVTSSASSAAALATAESANTTSATAPTPATALLGHDANMGEDQVDPFTDRPAAPAPALPLVAPEQTEGGRETAWLRYHPHVLEDQVDSLTDRTTAVNAARPTAASATASPPPANLIALSGPRQLSPTLFTQGPHWEVPTHLISPPPPPPPADSPPPDSPPRPPPPPPPLGDGEAGAQSTTVGRAGDQKLFAAGVAVLVLLLCTIGISTSSTYSCASARERKAKVRFSLLEEPAETAEAQV